MLTSVKEKEVSRLSAHATLAREFVDFLEYDVNYIIEAGYNLIGSLIMLFFYEKRVVLLCLFMLTPVLLLSYFYGRRMKRLNTLKNDELEKQVDAITSRNPGQIRNHFLALRKWQVKISDNEAYNFGVMEILVLIVLTMQ